jgi:hypothetical protein
VVRSNDGSYHKNNDVKQLGQELADVLEEDAKADKLRSLLRKLFLVHTLY